MGARYSGGRKRFSVAYGLSLIVHVLFFIVLFQLLAVRVEFGAGERLERQNAALTTIALERLRPRPSPVTPAPTVAPTRALAISIPRVAKTPKIRSKTTALRLPRPLATVEVSFAPTYRPTALPTPVPSRAPTAPPVATNAPIPTIAPTLALQTPAPQTPAPQTPVPTPPQVTPEPATPTPSPIPTAAPTTAPPTIAPTLRPTVAPSAEPTVAATARPTLPATTSPTIVPTIPATQTAAPTLAIVRTNPPATVAPAPRSSADVSKLEDRMRKMLAGIVDAQQYKMKSYAYDIAEAEKQLASDYDITHLKPPALKGIGANTKAFQFDVGQILYALRTVKVGPFEVCAGWLVTTRGVETPPTFYVGPCKKLDTIADPRDRTRPTFPTPPPLHN